MKPDDWTQPYSDFATVSILISLKNERRNFFVEENAIESFKDFGILVSTLKNPSSYNNYEALHRGLARSKYLDAVALVVKHTTKCFGKAVNPIMKEKAVEVSLHAQAFQVSVFLYSKLGIKFRILRKPLQRKISSYNLKANKNF